MEIQKNQAKVSSDSQLEQIKADLDSRKLQEEAQMKKELMECIDKK